MRVALVSTGIGVVIAVPAHASGIGERHGVQDVDEPTLPCRVVDGQREISLNFDPENSETDLRFRTAQRKTLNLVFNSACIIRAGDPEIDITLDPRRGDAEDLPDDVSAKAVPRFRRDGLTVALPVERSLLSPGSYDATVVVSGEELPTTRAPVTVFVKDGDLVKPVLVVLAGVLVGLVVSAFTAGSASREDFHPVHGTWDVLRTPWGIVAAVAAVGLGFFVPQGPFQALVVNSDDWVWSTSEAFNLAARAFATSASSAVLAGVLLKAKSPS